MEEKRASVGQIIGGIILVFTGIIPGLSLGGFHGGTGWSILAWLAVSLVGGFVAGLLIAPSHRIAGAVGGMIGAPLGMLALYLYSSRRETMYRAEAFIIWLIGALPGLGIYFVLRLLIDLVFPVRGADDYDDEDERPRRRKKKRRAEVDEEDEVEDDRPRSRRLRDEDDEEERPRRRRQDDDDDRPRRRRRYEDD